MLSEFLSPHANEMMCLWFYGFMLGTGVLSVAVIAGIWLWLTRKIWQFLGWLFTDGEKSDVHN